MHSIYLLQHQKEKISHGLVMMATKYASPVDIIRVEMNQPVSNLLRGFTLVDRFALSAFKEGTPQKYLRIMEVPA